MLTHYKVKKVVPVKLSQLNIIVLNVNSFYKT